MIVVLVALCAAAAAVEPVALSGPCGEEVDGETFVESAHAHRWLVTAYGEVAGQPPEWVREVKHLRARRLTAAETSGTEPTDASARARHLGSVLAGDRGSARPTRRRLGDVELEIVDRILGPDWGQLVVAAEVRPEPQASYPDYALERRTGGRWVAVGPPVVLNVMDQPPPPMAEPHSPLVCILHGRGRPQGAWDIQHHFCSERPRWVELGPWLHLAWADDEGENREVYLHSRHASLYPEPHCVRSQDLHTTGFGAGPHSLPRPSDETPMATPVDRPLTVTLFDEWGRPWSPEALDPREASYCSMALFNRDLPPHRRMASDVLPIEPPTPEDPWYDEVMSVSLTGQWWTICSEDEEDLLYRADVRMLVDFEPDGEGWRGSGRSIDGGAAFDLEARAVEVDGVVTLDTRLGLQGDRVATLHVSGERTGPWLRGEGTFRVEEGEAAPIVCKLYRDPRPGGLPPTPRHPDGLTREDLLRAFEEEQP